MHLLKSWRVSFYVTNKHCYVRKIARVDYSSQKMWHRSTIVNGFHGFQKLKTMTYCRRLVFIWRDTAVRTYFGTAITVFNNYLLPYPPDPLYLSHKNCHIKMIKFARVNGALHSFQTLLVFHTSLVSLSNPISKTNTHSALLN